MALLAQESWLALQAIDSIMLALLTLFCECSTA
jgi:hypothetical protein